VHRCIGPDGREDVDRVAQVIGELDPDVVALQEVDAGGCGKSRTDQFQLLGQATGMEAIAGITMTTQTGHYGNAVLTRLPVLAVDRINLSVPTRQPRGALDLRLDTWG